MALFGAPPPPKGIYEKELRFVEGELKQSGMLSDGRLSDRHVDEVMDGLRDSMDADTMQDMKYGFKYVSGEEVKALIDRLSRDKDLPFTAKQIEHVSRVLSKYVEIEKHPGLF